MKYSNTGVILKHVMTASTTQTSVILDSTYENKKSKNNNNNNDHEIILRGNYIIHVHHSAVCVSIATVISSSNCHPSAKKINLTRYTYSFLSDELAKTGSYATKLLFRIIVPMASMHVI